MEIGMSVSEATSVAQNFVSTNTEAVSSIEASMRSMVETIRGLWKGSSVDRYEALCMESQASFTRIKEIIEELGDGVVQAAAAFEEFDSSL